MGRAPCCEKVGLKKGPWSPEEDSILISYIEKYGHENWRALPKQAGLLRCGKSCRLRWMNYLKPDIKRGNFTREEEQTIIKLHEMLGNRWSSIAARIPGRTDNEIKNVWHTHLKKRLKQNQEAANKDNKRNSSKQDYGNIKKMDSPNSQVDQELSPQPSSSSDFSHVTNASYVLNTDEIMQSSVELFPPIDESFWSDISSMPAEYPSINDETSGIQAAEKCPTFSGESYIQHPSDFSSVMDGSLLQNSFAYYNYKEESTGGIDTFSIDDGMDFWYDLFMNPGECQN